MMIDQKQQKLETTGVKNKQQKSTKRIRGCISRDYKDLKGLVHEMGEMKIDIKPDV